MNKWVYTVLFILLFLLLQIGYRYHFFYIEQFQLFMFSEEYMRETLFQPGGLSVYLSEFIVQFFYYPFAGGIISAFLLILVSWLIRHVLKTNGYNRKTRFFFEGMVLLFLLVDMLDFNFMFAGIVAFLFHLIFFILYIHIKKNALRILTGCLMTGVLYLITGQLFVAFAIALTMLEFKMFGMKYGFSFIPAAFTIILLFILDYNGKLIFPEGVYFVNGIYTLKGGAGWIIYAPWLLFAFYPVFMSCLDILFAKIGHFRWEGVTQFLLLVFCGSYLLYIYDDRKSLPVKQYNYYANRGEWKKILKSCKERKPTDLLCLNYQNLALAEEGMLVDSLLMYIQKGSLGLFVDWNMTPFVSMTLQKICYCYGDIVSACKYAFEGNVCARSVGYPQTLKMLAQCNLLKKESPVTEKYLAYLHETLAYKNWQTDPGGSKLPVYGADYFIYRQDMAQLAYDNKQYKKLADYVLCSYLLDKNLEEFLTAFYYFYKDEKNIPVIYQEAIVIAARKNPQLLGYFSISGLVKERYYAYLAYYDSHMKGDFMGRNKEVVSEYTGCYWYYYDFNPVDL